MESVLLKSISNLFHEQIKRLIISILGGKPERSPIEHAAPLQIDNAIAYDRPSVFKLMEYGLKKGPDRPAVICTFQDADSLDDLIHGRADSAQNFVVNQTSVFASTRTVQSSCLKLTYSQLHHAALKLAAGLLANGVCSNTRMVMLIPNGGEYAILLWACILLRVTYTSLDPALLETSNGTLELKNKLSVLQPQMIVAPHALGCELLDDMMAEMNLSSRLVRLCVARDSAHRWISLFDAASSTEMSTIDQDKLVNAARNDDPDRIYNIMFTSGTSGNPKGCPMRIGGMSYMLASQSWLIDDEASPFALQQAHNSRGIAPAQIVQTWKAGGAVLMTGQNFNIHEALNAIKRFGVTFLVLTPPMVHELATELAVTSCDVSSVKSIQIGGDAVTKEVMLKCAVLFPHSRVCVNHGMTEGGGSFEWPFFDRSISTVPFFGEVCPIGKIAAGTSVRIWDTETNRAVAKGELGELHISCPSIIEHYLNHRSEESFYNDVDGRRWFCTGDNAMLNAEGLILILGRRSTMIKRNGVAIMPAVIESSVAAFTGSQTIVVSTTPSNTNAEPFAVIGSYNGKTKKDIDEFIGASLGNDYALSGIASLKELGLSKFPVNQTHKIIKSEVQEVVQGFAGLKRL